MASWPRFDLTDSSYAMGLMAQTTPAWREPYVAVLDQLIERHTGWWSANDWLTQFGHDPDRADYPDAYRLKSMRGSRLIALRPSLERTV